MPAATTSPSDLALASTPPTPSPGGILQLPPYSPYALWGSRVASSPAIDTTPQSQPAASLLSTLTGKLVNRFWRPRPQEAPRPRGGPVAEGDADYPVRDVAALLKTLKATPSEAPAILKQLIDIAKDGEDEPVREAAREAFLKAPEAAPSEAGVIIPILAAAAKEHAEVCFFLASCILAAWTKG